MAAASSLAALRSKIELDLRGRVLSPFNYRDRNVFEVVSTGIPSLDAAVGGLPRGAMTEICGPPCSGRTSLLLSALAARTAEGEACALVDARDSFDPALASAAGVALEKLLWVRCQNADQALRAADLLIQGGGFGLVAVDLSDVAPKIVRYVPLNAWFRFRRAVEDTPTILMVIEQEANAKTCASLVLRLKARPAEWSAAAPKAEAVATAATASAPRMRFGPAVIGKVGSGAPVARIAASAPVARQSDRHLLKHPLARLLRGFEIGADVVRTRVQDVNESMAVNEFGAASRERSFDANRPSDREAIFRAATKWSDFRG
jgi:recombination protein RecA